MDNVTMSRKEINQIAIFEKLKNSEINQVMAAQMLNLTTRQVRNKMKRYGRHGASGLIHQRRGMVGNRAWKDEIRQQALQIIKECYHDFGPTFAGEKLAQNHAILINRETLRKAMIQGGIWNGKKRKIRHRLWRQRKAYFGMMIQLDGSDHDWFEGRGPRCTLLVFIDDATSKIVWAQFVTGESVENLMNASYGYFRKYGLPGSLYVDRGSVFKVNKNNPNRELITQYERALSELGVAVIHARSSQAKGRVERSHQTFQDRLLKELRLADVSTIDAANRFLLDWYIDDHNARFAVSPESMGDVHRPLDGYNLDHILSIKEKRILANDFTISYHKRLLQIERQPNVVVRPKDAITILKLLDHSLVLLLRGKKVAFTEIKKRTTKPIIQRTYSNIYHRPASNHPWRGQKPETIQKPSSMGVI